MSTTTNTTPSAHTRLYISPLSPSLLNTVVPPLLHQSVRNVSYHVLETFPENKYGYIELLTEDAQKLRKKFNGAFLKGMKVRVEEARPDKKRKSRNEEIERGDGAADGVVRDGEERKQKRSQREKRAEGVLPAVELPEGREVKRGWVQPAGAKEEKKKKNKGNDPRKEEKKAKKEKAEKSEMLFRTTLPPNVASKTASKTDAKKDKSGKERQKGSKKAGKDVEIKEFSKSTNFPTFLRSSQVSTGWGQATEYVDGVGWVDEEGNVVEAVISTRSTRAERIESPRVEIPVPVEAEESSSADEGEESSKSDEEDLMPQHDESATSHEAIAAAPTTHEDDDDEEEDKVDEEDEENEEEEEEEEKEEEEVEVDDTSTDQNLPAIASSPTTKPTNTTTAKPSAATRTETPPPAPVPREVHPLEALFKRAPLSTTAPAIAISTPSKPTPTRPAPIVTSFSFFGDDEADDADAVDEASEIHPPQTPFTQRDLQFRRERSAAPTPDTAAVGKKMRAPWMPGAEEQDDDEDDDEEANQDEVDDNNEDEDATSTTLPPAPSDVAGTGAQGQTEFEKHFWEHRGEYNRGWKARKREARKEVRQSENRRGGVRVGRGVA